MQEIDKGPQTLSSVQNEVARLEKVLGSWDAVEAEIKLETEQVAADATRTLASDSGVLGDPRDFFEEEEEIIREYERSLSEAA